MYNSTRKRFLGITTQKIGINPKPSKTCNAAHEFATNVQEYKQIFTQHIQIESRALPLTWMLQIPKAQFSKHHILFRKHRTLPNQWNKSPWIFYEFKPLLWLTLLSLSMEVPSLIPSCSPTASSGSLMSTVGLRGGWPPHAAASAAEPRAKPEIRNQRGCVLNSRFWPALKAAASTLNMKR